MLGFTKTLEKVCRFASHLANLALLGMAGLVTADVLWDLIFGRPIANAIEIVSIYFMIAIVFLPMGFVELRGEHIRADIVSRFLSPRVQAILQLFVAFVSFLFLAVLVYQTSIDAVEAFEKNERVMGTSLLAIWPSRFSLPIGFGLLGLVMLTTALAGVFGSINAPAETDHDLEGRHDQS